MATNDAIAEVYADRIRSAMVSDLLTKTAAVNESTVKTFDVFAALKECGNDLDRYRIDEADKDDIARRTGEKLEIPDPDKMRRALKEASNDNYMALVSFIANLRRN